MENQKALKYCPSQSSIFALPCRGTQPASRQYNICLLSPTHLSRCCSQDLFAILREIWVLKCYCWHLYCICQLPLLSALSNLAGDIIFNPKTLGLDLIEVAMPNPGSLEKLHACGDNSAKSYYAVKCPVSGVFNFIWNSWTCIWHCFISLDVRIMPVC